MAHVPDMTGVISCSSSAALFDSLSAISLPRDNVVSHRAPSKRDCTAPQHYRSTNYSLKFNKSRLMTIRNIISAAAQVRLEFAV